jgi:hypothetical protein
MAAKKEGSTVKVNYKQQSVIFYLPWFIFIPPSPIWTMNPKGVNNAANIIKYSLLQHT